MKKGTTKKMKWTLILGLAVATLSLQVQAQNGVVIADLQGSLSGNSPQDINKLPQMDRDIIILQNVLGDLFKNPNSSWRSSGRTKGLYIPGNGVIFNVGGNGMFGGTEYVTLSQLSGQVTADGSVLPADKSYTEEDLAKLNEDKKDKIANSAKTFLADYGSLLVDLKNNEKIQLSIDYSIHVQSTSRKIDGLFAYVSSSRDENKRRMTAEISASDLNAYTTGSISQSEVFSRIKTNTYDTSKDEMLDAKILAGIFDDMFKNTYDGYLTRSGAASWTYFEGFGLMYNVNLSSGRNGYTLSTTSGGQSVVSVGGNSQKSEDFYSDIKSKYPAFEKSVKETMIKYGRTLRSLKSTEFLILNVGLNANNLSGLPKSIQLMISKSDIDAFTKGDRSLQQVMDKISLKKLTASLGGGVSAPLYSYGSSYVQSQNVVPTADRVINVDRAPSRSVVRGKAN
jgi:hypothetical protein